MENKRNIPQVGKMTLFKPWVGKVIFIQTTAGFSVITPLNNQLLSQSFGDFSVFILFVFFHVMYISQSSFWRYFISLDARLLPRLCNILYVVILQPILATFWIDCTSGVRVNG